MDIHAITTETHQGCFACGHGNPLGLGLEFTIDADGVVTADWQPRSTFQSYPDRLHGGLIATLLDAAMVHALFSKGIRGVTAEITIRYLKIVSLMEPVHLMGRLQAVRHGIYLCRAELSQNGNCAARASAKFMAMPTPITLESS